MWTIDFETRSHADLKKRGVYVYAADPSTEVLCLAWKENDGPTKAWPGDDPTELLEGVRRGDEIHAHNGMFEFLIWPRFLRDLPDGGPMLHISQMRCSLAQAAMVGLPQSLDALAAAMNASVQKDKEGERLMRTMCKPDKHGRWVYSDAMLDRLIQYCKRDVDTEHACEKLLPPLPPGEQKLWELTQIMNTRGLRCDVEMCSRAITWLDAHYAKSCDMISEWTDGMVTSANQVAKLTAAIRAEGTVLKSLSKGDIDKAIPTTDKAAALIDLRKGAAMASVKKFKAMIAMAGSDHRIRGTLGYHGAATGRWVGKGIQPQNFPRGTVKDIPMVLDALTHDVIDVVFPDPAAALSSALRAMLLGPFLAGDYSAIEARVLCWLAGESEFVKAYHEGKDTYILMARKIYGLTGDVTPEQRQLGKKVELGAGFGIGEEKFLESCVNEGIAITKEMASRCVKEYRESHPHVVAFWRAMELSALDAIRLPGRICECGAIKWKYLKPWLMMRLPSGRKLWYYSPRIVNVEHKSKKTGKSWFSDQIEYVSQYQGKAFADRTFGPRLVENATQAVARDVMAEAMIRLEECGYQCVLTVHDEIVALQQFGQTEKEFRDLMEFVPEWASGLPLKVGTWAGPRYRK